MMAALFFRRQGSALLRWMLSWRRTLLTTSQVLVLAFSPASYTPRVRRTLAHHIYVDTVPILAGFTILAAMLTAVITRIVISTAARYGMSGYAMDMTIRVLVIELIPLMAALFVAMRCSIPNGAQLALMRENGEFDAQRAAGFDPLHTELFPRVLASIFSCFMLTMLSCAVAALQVYLVIYGFTTAGFAAWTRMVGQVFTPALSLVLAFKLVFFSLCVAAIPTISGMFNHSRNREAGAEMRGLVRMFAVLLIIETISMIANYY